MTVNATRYRLAPAAVALALVAGCASHKKDNGYIHGENFPGPGEPRAVNQLLDAQVASGAGLDQTLHGFNFDGENLNTLGQEKLDMMLRAESTCYPMKIYLETSQDDPALAARKVAVVAYLKDKGLTDEQVKIEVGPNTGYNSPAAESVRELRLLQSGDSTGAPGGQASVTATPGAAASH